MNRQTLLFSATMTASLSELEKLAAHDTVHFDLTSSSFASSSSSSSSSSRSRGKGTGEDNNDNDNDQNSLAQGSGVQRMPSRLKQEFLFMPAQVHTSQSNQSPSQMMPSQMMPSQIPFKSSVIAAHINTQSNFFSQITISCFICVIFVRCCCCC